MREKILSVFIDESGDFGEFEPHAPYYIVSMVLHDQGVDIQQSIKNFNSHLSNLGYLDHAVHTGPLIRRESIYKDDLAEDRKRLFNALFHFVRGLDIHYISVSVKKSECENVIDLTAKLSKAISNRLKDAADYIEHFDHIIIYYDNGQIELTKILTSVFNALFLNVEFRKVSPVDYKLFQVADLICTSKLMTLKMESGGFSRSESDFFENARAFKKNYLKHLEKLEL